jgi:hypothetical protein
MSSWVAAASMKALKSRQKRSSWGRNRATRFLPASRLGFDPASAEVDEATGETVVGGGGVGPGQPTLVSSPRARSG